MPTHEDDRWPWESEENSPPRSSQRISSIRPSSTFQRRSGGSGKHHQLQVSVPTEAFVKEMLTAHNEYRTVHQAPPLTLDKELTRGAQEWAEILANQERLEPDMDSRNSHIGENLAMKYNSERTDFSGSEFTDYWYSGVVDFDFEEKSPKVKRGSSVLSFTQLIWKATKIVGFGRAVSRKGKVYVVGRYYPGGNSAEGFAENVLQASVSSLSFEDRSNERTSRRSRMSVGPSRVSRQSEFVQPVIGAMKPVDTLVSSNKSTVFENDKTIVTIEEKYITQDGSTYTRQRKTTYIGEYQNDN